MSNMKCPFCQQELLLSSYRDDDTAHQMWNCLCCQLSAQRKIWQELIRTKKELNDIEGKHEKLLKHIAVRSNREQELRDKLDIAVDALKVYANQENWDCEHFYSLDTYDIAADALEQITALTKGGNNGL